MELKEYDNLLGSLCAFSFLSQLLYCHFFPHLLLNFSYFSFFLSITAASCAIRVNIVAEVLGILAN